MMKTLLTRLLPIGLVITVLSGSAMLAFADTATMYLNPASASVQSGNSFNVAVRVNSGTDAINAVQANLSYDAGKLEVTGISYSGSAFEIQAENSYGGGSIKIARGTLSPVSGDKLIGTITFKAKVSSGSTSVNFAAGSSAVRASDSVNILAGTSGGTYSFTAPPSSPSPSPEPSSPSPSPSPSPTPSTAPSPSSGPSTAPAPPPTRQPVQNGDTTPPVISDIRIETTDSKEVIIRWSTDEPATSQVQYGLSDSYEFSAGQQELITEHAVTLNKELITPGVHYRYRIVSADAAGNTSTSDSKTFNGAEPVTKEEAKKKSPVAMVAAATTALLALMVGAAFLINRRMALGRSLSVRRFTPPELPSQDTLGSTRDNMPTTIVKPQKSASGRKIRESDIEGKSMADIEKQIEELEAADKAAEQ